MSAQEQSAPASQFKALETRYSGRKYRSRLEARWAVLFDCLRIAFDYELEGFQLGDGTWYLPDFFLPQIRSWAEVKPLPFTDLEKRKCALLAAGTKQLCLMLDGSPALRTYDGFECNYGADEPQVCDFLLDIDWHVRRYYEHEHRLYGSTGGEFENVDMFTWQYHMAVDTALSERFE